MQGIKCMLTLLITLFLQEVSSGQNLLCSAFVDTTAGTKLGKNLDWALGNGIVVYNPAGELKRSATCDNNGKVWTSKYSSVTFNHFGNNMPLGGMNETGLLVEELSTWPVDYPSNLSGCLNELEWIQYQLDSFSSVEEVIEDAGNVYIDKFLFGIHYIIADKRGNTAIIEFISGEAKIFSGRNLPYRVVTNNNYSDQLRYYNLFEEGDLKIHDVENSQDRFIKLLQLTESNDAEAGLSCRKMIGILDSMRVADTRWSIVYDTKNMEFHFKTDLNDAIRSIAFSDFLNSNKKMYSNFYHDDTLLFREMNNEENYKYLLNLRDDILGIDPEDESGMAQETDILIKGLRGKELK